MKPIKNINNFYGKAYTSIIAILPDVFDGIIKIDIEWGDTLMGQASLNGKESATGHYIYYRGIRQ